MVVARFEVYLVRLDPTQGHEIRKTRPCVVISPDEMNRHIGTVIVAPLTTKGRPYPTRIPVRFQRKSGQVVLDQIHTIDLSGTIANGTKLRYRTGEVCLMKASSWPNVANRHYRAQKHAMSKKTSMNTKELIDRIFKEPDIKFELTEFENLGKPIHDIITIYPKVATSG